MYVQSNTVTRLLNRLAVETQQCILFVVVVVVIVVVELHVTVKYITILSVTQQCFYGKFVTENANYK
jgi:hypothetical protein